MRASAREMVAAYHDLVKKGHDDRAEQFEQAIDKIKGRPEWIPLARLQEAASPGTALQPVLRRDGPPR